MAGSPRFRAALAVAALVAAAAPPAAAQQVSLLATGEIEWSTAGYHPQNAFISKPGGYAGEFPYLHIQANLDSIRGRLGAAVVDNPNAHHLRSVQHGLTFASQEEEFRHPFGRTAEFLRNADVTFGLLAMPLSTRARFRRTGVLGHPNFVDALKWAGFDVLALANNRMMDAETVGLMDTRAVFDSVGLGGLGIGGNLEEARKPYIVERNGLRIAFLGYSSEVTLFGVDGFVREDAPGVMPLDPFLIREDIRRVRGQVDFVVLSFHWGILQNQESHPLEQEFARAMIDAGGDIILGHHTHQPTGVEVYKGKVIIYSLANFAFNHSHSFFKDNYVARLTLAKGGVIPEVELVPMAGFHKDIFQPYRLEGERAQALLKDIQARSAKFGTELTIKGDVGVIRPPVRITSSKTAPESN